MTVSEMLARMDSAELAEQIAFDALKDEQFRERLTKEKELAESREQDVDERKQAFLELVRRTHGNNR